MDGIYSQLNTISVDTIESETEGVDNAEISIIPVSYNLSIMEGDVLGTLSVEVSNQSEQDGKMDFSSKSVYLLFSSDNKPLYWGILTYDNSSWDGIVGVGETATMVDEQFYYQGKALKFLYSWTTHLQLIAVVSEPITPFLYLFKYHQSEVIIVATGERLSVQISYFYQFFRGIRRILFDEFTKSVKTLYVIIFVLGIDSNTASVKSNKRSLPFGN